MLRDGSMNGDASWCGTQAERGRQERALHGGGREERCESVHRTLKRIAKARAALDAQEAGALREADQLGLWRLYGYSSLPEYMEMELGYTPRAAAERLRVANAIVELSAIGDALSQGEASSFSAARELTRVATPETERVWLEAAKDKNLRDIEQLVSGHKKGDGPDDPVDPKLRKRTLRYDDVDEETVAILKQARQILDRELGERLDNNHFLRALGRMVIDHGAVGVRVGARADADADAGADAGARAGARAGSCARTRAPYQIAITTCERCKRAWQDGGGITVEMSPATQAMAECDALHIGSVDALESQSPKAAARTRSRQSTNVVRGSSQHSTDKMHEPLLPSTADAREPLPPSTADARESSQESTADSRESSQESTADSRESSQPASRAQRGGEQPAPAKRARTAIPPALRRKVNARDHGRCRVPWCRASFNIDQHHIVPISEGGVHMLENILNLCESHHIALHEGALILEGDATNARFTRRAQSSFEATRHAVETAKALRTLGFRKDEVTAAMEKTIRHVDTAQLTIEQWIRIALSYCPRPLR